MGRNNNGRFIKISSGFSRVKALELDGRYYYLLTCMDGRSVDDKNVPAREVATTRLRAKEWPLYANTAHTTRFSKNDVCLIYVGGTSKGGQHFIGLGIIDRIVTAPRKWSEADSKLLSAPASSLLQFSDVELWTSPVCIRDYINELRFITNKKRWGLHLIGGAKIIPREDYETIRDR